MDMQSLINDLVDSNMIIPDYPNKIKVEGGGDTPPKTGDVRIWEKKYELFLKEKRCLKIIKTNHFLLSGTNAHNI